MRCTLTYGLLDMWQPWKANVLSDYIIEQSIYILHLSLFFPECKNHNDDDNGDDDGE